MRAKTTAPRCVSCPKKNHPSVLRLPKHFVFALDTLADGCYLACYVSSYNPVTLKSFFLTCYFAVTETVTSALLGIFGQVLCF